LSYSLLTTFAHAAVPLRITGTVNIDASASYRNGTSELQVRLLDDAGHAVPSAELGVKPITDAHGKPWSAHECHPHAPELTPTADGVYVVRSDGAGALCVAFEGTPERAEFELAFSDPNGLYAPATRQLVADSATRSVEVAFAPAPSDLSLERETQSFPIATREKLASGAAPDPEPLHLSLTLARAGQPTREIAQTVIATGESAEFRVPSRSLGGPGPVELSVEFAGSPTTRAAHAVAHVTCTATAELSLAAPVLASHPENGVLIRVRVGSSAGPVPSGTVEARSGDTSVGSARVVDGNTELFVQLDEAAARARPLELRYVADSQWWLPGTALSVELPVLPPSQWRRVAWILAATALGLWLLIGWQRPRRLERALAPPARRAQRAAVDVVAVHDARSGWSGRVLDAHDSTPLASAMVLVRVPVFEGDGVLRSARTDDQGAFRIESIDNAGPGAALEVRAPWHTPLTAPMPPAGDLVLSLVSRRRTLLARFVAWAGRDGVREPTPGELARNVDRPEIARWARAVDEAAYGPEPLTETKERVVLGQEPAAGVKQPGR